MPLKQRNLLDTFDHLNQMIKFSIINYSTNWHHVPPDVMHQGFLPKMSTRQIKFEGHSLKSKPGHFRNVNVIDTHRTRKLIKQCVDPNQIQDGNIYIHILRTLLGQLVKSE